MYLLEKLQSQIEACVRETVLSIRWNRSFIPGETGRPV